MAAVLVATALTLAGCGGSEQASDKTSDGKTSTSATASTGKKTSGSNKKTTTIEDGLQTIVVPLGTMKRLQAGEKVGVMPTRVDLKVGETLRIRNEDTSRQLVGPYFVPPGEELELNFGAAGTYEGFCAIAEDQRYEFVVTE